MAHKIGPTNMSARILPVLNERPLVLAHLGKGAVDFNWYLRRDRPISEVHFISLYSPT
jgi:hypothetical protein